MEIVSDFVSNQGVNTFMFQLCAWNKITFLISLRLMKYKVKIMIKKIHKIILNKKIILPIFPDMF